MKTIYRIFFPVFALLEHPDAVAGSVVVAHRKLLYIEKIVATLLIAAPRISGQLKGQVDALQACRDESELNIKRKVSSNHL